MEHNDFGICFGVLILIAEFIKRDSNKLQIL